MKKDYKKFWIKLRELIKDDKNISYTALLKAKNEENCLDMIEYKQTICTYDFLLKAMEEIEGTQHHNIFSFKGQK